MFPLAQKGGCHVLEAQGTISASQRHIMTIESSFLQTQILCPWFQTATLHLPGGLLSFSPLVYGPLFSIVSSFLSM